MTSACLCWLLTNRSGRTSSTWHNHREDHYPSTIAELTVWKRRIEPSLQQLFSKSYKLIRQNSKSKRYPQNSMDSVWWLQCFTIRASQADQIAQLHSLSMWRKPEINDNVKAEWVKRTNSIYSQQLVKLKIRISEAANNTENSKLLPTGTRTGY